MNSKISHIIQRHIQASIIKNQANLIQLKNEFAKAAQKVYDEWDQSGVDGDSVLGFGGICQDIADAFSEILNGQGIDSGTVSQTIGDQHVYALAKVKEGVFIIDISPYVYERGGGYTWSKILGVIFKPTDIIVSMIDSDPDKLEEYLEQP